MARTIEIQVSIPPKDAIARLADAIDDIHITGLRSYSRVWWRWARGAMKRGMMGHAAGGKFYMYYRHPLYGNGFAPLCRGTVQATDEGSAVRASFRLNPVGQWAMALWFISLGAVCVGAAGMDALNESTGLFVLMGCGALIVWIVTAVGKKVDEPHMRNLLKDLFRDVTISVEEQQ